MRPRFVLLGLGCCLAMVPAGAWSLTASVPPGRQYRLSIEGENTVTFLPQAGLAPVKVDYKAKVEYIVDTRYGKPSKEATDPVEEAPSKKVAVKKGSRAKAKEAEAPAPKVTGAIDLSLHSTEMAFRQNDQTVVETKMTRARFQGRLQPDSPALNVTATDAPARLQEMLKNYDVVAASLLLDDDLKVVNRKYRFEGPQRAVIETLLSIHTPIPKGVDSWESPTQLAMGQGHTAKGRLRFEKDKPKDGDGRSTDAIKVKVSGVLKAEGVIAGNYIKDGQYQVTGEQTFNDHDHEWTSSRWSVAVVNELANQAGRIVAQVKGTMTVESRALPGGAGGSASEGAVPKL